MSAQDRQGQSSPWWNAPPASEAFSGPRSVAAEIVPPSTGDAAPGGEEEAPILQEMRAPRAVQDHELARQLDTPAYRSLLGAGLITTQYRKSSFEQIFEGTDLKASASQESNISEKLKYGWCIPVVGCIIYHYTHSEFFVPAGHVGLCLGGENQYLFAGPGMHNVASCWMKYVGTAKVPMNDALTHGNRVILVVEQGYVALAYDNGQPTLFPPGIHVWTSETLKYHRAISLDLPVVSIGPFTLLTVDEGYAAVTQNNGKQEILPGGHTHLLTHKNWQFEKLITLKLQTDNLQQITATSADNIVMVVTSTVTWRVVDPRLAAIMGAATMSTKSPASAKAPTDIGKIRSDVLKQATASLSMFVGGVNYTSGFAMAAELQQAAEQCPPGGTRPPGRRPPGAGVGLEEPQGQQEGQSNPLQDPVRMQSAVAHANETTMSYGVEILSINILVAEPTDTALSKALAGGAIASAAALQAETAARGKAKATSIDATANAERVQIAAEGDANARLIKARAHASSVQFVAEGQKKAADLLSTSRVAVELARVEKSARALGKAEKFFFGLEPGPIAQAMPRSRR